MNREKIAACVVLYQPDQQLFKNITSYCEEISRVFVIDNSDVPTDMSILQAKYPFIQYIFKGGNLGIATALNEAVHKARAEGFEWILTMDQDSSFAEGALSLYLTSFDAMDKYKVGIVSLHHHMGEENAGVQEWEQINSTMTSGNLLNIECHLETGGFLDKLFIDYVDHEFCLRIRKQGYAIWQNNRVNLIHQLGALKVKKIFGLSIPYTNHHPIRRYYITRNRLYVIFKYFAFSPSSSLTELSHMINEGIKIVLFEKDKLKKAKSIILGIKDFIFSNFGKYPY